MISFLTGYGSTHSRLTSSPFPQNLASSSMPSSCMTVESTSKHTQSAVLNNSCTLCWGDITLIETRESVLRVARWRLLFKLFNKDIRHKYLQLLEVFIFQFVPTYLLSLCEIFNINITYSKNVTKILR